MTYTQDERLNELLDEICTNVSTIGAIVDLELIIANIQVRLEELDEEFYRNESDKFLQNVVDNLIKRSNCND